MPAYLGHTSYKADRGKIAYGLLERFIGKIKTENRQTGGSGAIDGS